METKNTSSCMMDPNKQYPLKQLHNSLVFTVIDRNCDMVLFQGHKYCTNVEFQAPGSYFDQSNPDNYDCPDLGYASYESKMRQLMSHYYNEESIKAAVDQLNNRTGDGKKFTSVAISCVGGDKKKTSQGHCIQTIIISLHETLGINITVFYRTTEICQKFAADLLFLKHILFPAIIGDKPINQVYFYFSTVYLSPLYTMAFVDGDNVDRFIKTMDHNRNSSRMPSTVFKAIVRSLECPTIIKDPSHYAFASRRRMHNLLLKKFDEDPEFESKISDWSKNMRCE